MAKSDGASAPTGQERSLFLLLRESGDANEAASPPFDVAAGEAQLHEAAWARGLLRPDDLLGKDLAVTAASLEEEAPPFDVDAGAARLKSAAHARDLLSSSALEASEEAASRRLNLHVHDRVALDEIELYAEVLSAVAASERPLSPEELDEVLGVREVTGATAPRREEKSPASPASQPRHHSEAGKLMLVQSHPGGGYLELVADNDVIALRCHWPVDLSADEWIDIENHYHILSYLRAVDDSMVTGNGEAQGISGGFLRVSSIADGFIIEFSRPQGGWSASSLRLHVRRSITDLLPRRNALVSRPAST